MEASSAVHNRNSAMNNNGGDVQRGHPQQYHHHPGAGAVQPQRQQFQSQQHRQFGAGNRPTMMSGPLNSGINQSPIAGQKRDSSGFAVGGGGNPHGAPAQQESADGGNFVKLFVGSVPRTITEDDVRPLFAEHGNVLEVALIKDRRTGQQQGCCFIKYATVEEAERAIKALHNQRTLPGGTGPIHVRFADGEQERLGTLEHKLFVASLSRQATEKEIEEIFASFGCVEDVYLMRDEQKQSRGCAFVKYTTKEMAAAAVEALNGIYVMRGCEQPLSVRFAEPKRPKAGDARTGPVFGGPGFGPGQHGPIGARPTSGLGRAVRGRGPPPPNWRPMSAQNMGPLPHVVPRPYSNPATNNRVAPADGLSPMGASVGGPRGPMNGPVRGPVPAPTQMGGPGMMTMPSQQQGFNRPTQWQTQAYGQQSPQIQQQHVPASVLQHQQPQKQPLSQQQHSQQSLQQYGQLQQSQIPAQQQPPPLRQLPAVQPSALYEQLPVSQSQVQQHATPLQQQVNPSVQLHHMPVPAMHQQQIQAHPHSEAQPQQPAIIQSVQQLQPPALVNNIQSQHPSMQQQQFLPMQTETQSQQPTESAQYQQQQMQSYSQTAAIQQPLQIQPRELSGQPQAASSIPAIAPATAAPTAIMAASVVCSSSPQPAPVTCNWSEHTSPDGHKYYYNSVTGESKWDKPEEFAAFEQQQKQSQPVMAHAQPAQLQSQAQQSLPNHESQLQQPQVQFQQPMMATPQYSFPGMAIQQQPIQNQGYAQLQGVRPAFDPSSQQVQQFAPTMQDWMWKGKPAGA